MRIKNPCKGICDFLDNQCRGCFRTMDERIDWHKMTDDQKAKVMVRTVMRKRKAAA